jgi:hypothetical protein
MVKCGACAENKCEGSYAKRDLCENKGNCSCTCQESGTKTFWKAAGSIAAGVGIVAGR